MDCRTDPIGTKHPTAKCCWCDASLVVAQVEQKRCWLCPNHAQRQVDHALFVKATGKEHAKKLGVPTGTLVCLNVPLPSQVLFEDCAARNVLWGGQAGPGKSHGVRWWLYKRCLTTPGHQALLLRENWEQLDKHHLRAMKEEVPLLGGSVVDRTAHFPEGSVIDCGHMADAEAVSRYLSSEYSDIVPDEASQYPVNSDGISTLPELATRARKVGRDRQGSLVKPRFLPVSNPGGPSAPWLLDMFVDHTPDFEKFPALQAKYRAEEWVYIPARLEDNPYQDPSYEDTLAGLSKFRYEQLRHGDWHVFSGQFFSQWLPSVHTRVVAIAPTTDWFASMDWGYNAPGCVIWWACLPDGHYHLAKAWKFDHMTAEEVGVEIKKHTKSLGIKRLRYLVADPAMWQKTGAGRGQAIAETLSRSGLPMRRGDNDRFNGWARCQTLLRLDASGLPWLTIDPIEAKYLARTIPAAVSNPSDPDDVDTTIDDHGLDAWRYGAMSRPHPTLMPVKTTPRGSAGRLLEEHVRDLAVA